MKKKKILFIIIFFIYMLMICTIVFSVSKYGSRGNEVKQIQTKLKRWGYYNGDIDGIFGSQTFNAVKNFQKKNGLKADGIVGEQTLKALGINSTSNDNKTINNNTDLNLLSKLINAEARGEPYTGMVAVASTVLNRVADSKFPNTVAGVIYQAGAYTCVQDGQINLEGTEQSKKAAQDALNGWDPTSGCIYYFNPSTATSSWIWSRKQVVTIGKHIFCK